MWELVGEGVGLQICVVVVAVEGHAKGRFRAVEEHAEDAWLICIATVVAEEHTEGLAAAEIDDGADGGACGETCGGRQWRGVFFVWVW